MAGWTILVWVVCIIYSEFELNFFKVVGNLSEVKFVQIVIFLSSPSDSHSMFIGFFVHEEHHFTMHLLPLCHQPLILHPNIMGLLGQQILAVLLVNLLFFIFNGQVLTRWWRCWVIQIRPRRHEHGRVFLIKIINF